MENKIKSLKNLNDKSSRKYSDSFSILKLSLLLILNISAVHCLYEEYRKPSYLEGKVGSYVVFNCHIDFPQEDHPIPYILNWKKGVKYLTDKMIHHTIIHLLKSDILEEGSDVCYFL
jgi:hypothetical protein